MVGVIRDITREKGRRGRPSRKRGSLRHAVELSPQIPWIADADGNILEAGPLWMATTGRGAAETLGRVWAEALHPNDADRRWRGGARRWPPATRSMFATA